MSRTIGAFAVAAGIALSPLPARADAPLKLDTRLGQSVMKTGETQRNFLRVAVGGCEREKTDRTPVNVAFVIDRSGSMAGMRIAQAREAAIMAVKRLNADDIASVVIFDNQIETLVSAQKVTDHATFVDRILQVGTRGSTAIYGGVTQGASEVRTHKDNRRLNRVVLLSDGRANVGPSNAEAFESLGRSLLAEGISVSTIGLGLGYNEDLMLKLARASDGNHAFASDAAALIPIFNREFNDVLSSCAQMVSIDVEMKPGIRIVRALSRDGKIEGQHATFRMNQVYQATEHYVLLEVEVDKTVAEVDADGNKELGRVRVAYTAPKDGAQRTLDSAITGAFSASEEAVKASRDMRVMEAAVEQTTRERTLKAIALRDQGKLKEAQALFKQNVADITGYTATAAKPSARLEQLAKEYGAIAAAAPVMAPAQAAAEWGRQRKMLRQLDKAAAGSSVRY
jgi:Ca-activated chloride channel family protein